MTIISEAPSASDWYRERVFSESLSPLHRSFFSANQLPASRRKLRPFISDRDLGQLPKVLPGGNGVRCRLGCIRRPIQSIKAVRSDLEDTLILRERLLRMMFPEQQ